MTIPDTTSLLGKRFGRLMVVERDFRPGCCDTYWRVRCDCGTEFSALAGRLRRGLTRSCGCLGEAGGPAAHRLRREEETLEGAGHPRTRARNPLADPRTLPALRGKARKREAERLERIIREVDKVPRGKLE